MRFVITMLLAATLGTASAQLAKRTETGAQPEKTAPHRTRLILKDGSFQIIMSYSVVGRNVRYVSAERGGQTEEIPLDLVDLDATKKWETAHAAVDPDAPRAAPALDPELLRLEAERAEISPEVAPDLHLAPEDAVLALDTFRATPELVLLTQTDGEMNKQTSHNILRGMVNPVASAHQMTVLKGEKANVQIHVADPAFYLKLDDALPDGGHALTVDTHGASAQTEKKKQGNSDYVIVRVDVRQDARVLASFRMADLGVKHQEDVFEVNTTMLPGGHWMKIVPREQLLVGEYALVEILDEKSINLGVWDFGIHSAAPENRDVIRPEKKRPVTLEKRQKQ